ncbi:MAG: shikimate dehydrogenase [Spirochaetia bacterium]|nr:shikimate dehydrogenase [Spirochaetia bacterium]
MHSLEINGQTSVFGILGNPVSHSLSPAMHNAAFKARNVNAVYVPFPAESVQPTLKKALLSFGIKGLSVTIPHKIWAAKIADQQDPLTSMSGAANTLLFQKNAISAYNTDGPGAVRALHERHRAGGKRYLICGYGGSSVAIAHSLLLESRPAAIWITGRNIKKAQKLVQDLSAGHPKANCLLRAERFDKIQPEEIDMLIQTTPSGMSSHNGLEGVLPELNFDPAWIRKNHVVFDIVYTPMRTPLLDLAEKKGASVVYGYKMLLYQATRQFELFTGQKAPESLMERVLLSNLKAKRG